MLNIIKEILNNNTIDNESETYYDHNSQAKIIDEPHIHDFYELLLIESGEITMNILDNEYTLREGCLILVRPGDMHCRVSTSTECRLVYLGFLQKTMDELFNFIYDQSIKDNLLTWENLPVVALTRSESEILFKKIRRLSMLPFDRKRLVRSQMRVLLTDIINQYFLTYLVKPFSIGSYESMPEWLNSMLAEMEEPKYFNLTLDNWCEKYYLSKAYTCRTFKKFTGTTFSKHSNSIKINYAANLLNHTNMQIIDIALECGYQNLSHFYHQFRKRYTQTPHQFRRKSSEESM